MTVRELIERLAELPPDLEVIIGEDREGNLHSPEQQSASVVLMVLECLE